MDPSIQASTAGNEIENQNGISKSIWLTREITAADIMLDEKVH